MLSNIEQEELYSIITTVLGEDAMIKRCTYQFNDRTIAIVEDAITASIKCNSTMKELVINLAGASVIASKGWLKRVFKEFSKRLKDKSVKFSGYGCLV